MIKFLLILILFFYALYKIGGFLFRMLFQSVQQQHRQQYQGHQNGHYQQSHTRRAPDSNLNIDHIPEKDKEKRRGDFKGGDYVDYEEVD